MHDGDTTAPPSRWPTRTRASNSGQFHHARHTSMARLNVRSLLTGTSFGPTMPRQSRQSTCESKSGSSTTTGLGHTAHSVERLLLTALRSWVKSHPSRKRWKVRTTSGKSEFGTANGGSTSSSANIIGGRRNPCRLSAPRVPTRQRNGLQESETMSANRTAELRMVSRPLRGQRAHRTLEAAPQRAQAPQRASLSTSGW